MCDNMARGVVEVVEGLVVWLSVVSRPSFYIEREAEETTRAVLVFVSCV